MWKEKKKKDGDKGKKRASRGGANGAEGSKKGVGRVRPGEKKEARNQHRQIFRRHLLSTKDTCAQVVAPELEKKKTFTGEEEVCHKNGNEAQKLELLIWDVVAQGV